MFRRSQFSLSRPSGKELEASTVLPAILEVRSLYDQYRFTKTLNTIKPRCFVYHIPLVPFFITVYMVVCFVCFCLCKLCTFIMFMYYYCYVYVFVLLCMFCSVYCFIMLFCVLFECKCVLLPPGVNPIALNNVYHIINHNIIHLISRYMLIGPYFHSKYLNSCF
jgi:hypothetical protein